MFQFPSNGKVYPKFITKDGRKLFFRFNSLQTGKCIQRFSVSGWGSSPSTSSFNSLQTGKCIQRIFWTQLLPVAGGFNSLQTGKCIQSVRKSFMLSSSTMKSFNSLQTGKCIQRTVTAQTSNPWFRVSIPFKRESVSKDTPSATRH